MKKIPFLFLIIIISSCKGFEGTTSEDVLRVESKDISIIPKPSELTYSSSSVTIPRVSSICYNTAEAGEAAAWLTVLLKRANLEVEELGGNSCGNWNLTTDESLKSSLGEEGYILEIKNEGLFLQAATSAGLFYGIQTIRQILPASLESSVSVSNGIELQQLYIKDVPRYSWRGTMVDISRSF
ncbi:MAG TPA: glycoside hydrolase family 20 zincin-like fold domain-containing protein, partial [Gillisia sp.]|nr:glycoside hydrolase family 20 zincin-like fold domain-containing protein [Gillisia sp.]